MKSENGGSSFCTLDKWKTVRSRKWVSFFNITFEQYKKLDSRNRGTLPSLSRSKEK